jgi:small subunit ribosomal protein S17
VEVKRKTRVGRVVSDKMQKTVVVQVEVLKHHRLYGRLLRRHANYKAHDEGNKAKIGDKVLIAETRPLSKDKRWRVMEILTHATITPAERVAQVESEQS